MSDRPPTSTTRPPGPAPAADAESARRRAEEERDRFALQRQLALDAARLGWWHYDPATRVATYDARYVEIFGVTGHERPGGEILKLLHPQDLPRVWRAVEAALDPRNPQPYTAEYRVIRPDGAEVWVEAHGVATFAGEGQDRHATSLVGTVEDITRRKRAEAELRESTALLRAISDTSEDAIWAKDRLGRIRFANPAMLRLIGKPAAQVLGRTDLDFLDDPAAARTIMENDHRIMQRGETQEVEEALRLPDGTPSVWLSRKTPYRNAEGEVVGIFGISREITDRRRAEEAVRESDRRKTEFLAVLSHELRNPLAPIRNGIWLLERAAHGSPQAARAREVIQRQTEHLTRLVDDLLDVTRISRGKIELQRDRVELREIVRKTTEDLRSLFESAGVTLAVEAGSAPAWVDADPTRLGQVLGNLLQNAAKFTRVGGHVAVSLSVAGGDAVLAVRDDGVGLPPGDIERMFEPFAQASSDLARSHGGLGLGLALVKGLVELHGGTVRARSEGPGRGAEFEVRLPLAPAARPAAAPAADEGAAEARLVLVVEDNVDAGQSLADILALNGHEVRLATCGREGIALARELRPDVVVCDIGLPDVDGYEVARTLRGEGELAATRLVALSGYAQPDDVRRALEAGFDAHVAKPPDPNQLERLLG